MSTALAVAILPMVFAADAPVNNTDEVRSIVAEMLADADSRSSMLQATKSGHDGKFRIQDEAGNFSLQLGGYMQFRYTASFRNNDDTGDDFESGFVMRRTKLTFRGHLYDPRLTYRTTFAFNRATGNGLLEIAKVGWRFDDNWSISAGQDKLPFLREENISSTKQIAVDRSPTTEIFNQFFSQRIEFKYQDDGFRAQFAVSDGFRSLNTDFASLKRPSVFGGVLGSGEADYAVTVRADRKFGGNFKQFDDFTGSPGQESGAILGAAVHFEGGNAAGTISGESYKFLGWVLDVQAEGSGWSAFTSVNGFHTDNGSEEPNYDDFGIVAQAAAYIPDSDIELFARYDITLPDSARDINDPFDTVTVGGTYWIHGHAAKAILDLQWFLADEPALPGASPGIGYLVSTAANSVTLRLQFQIVF